MRFWPFTANLLFFAGAACVAPFLVLYYQRLGFSGPQIGVLTGITPLVTLLSAPLWTNLADKSRRHRLIASLLAIGTALSFLALPWLHTFWPVLLVAVVASAAFTPITAFIDSATMVMLGGRKEMYGRVRLGGTFGWGVMGSVAGVLVQHYGLKLVFWTAAAALLLVLITLQKLAYGPLRHDEPRAGSVRTLLADRRWLPFLALAFAGGLATVISTAYLLPYMRELGANESTMGLAITMGTLSEVPVLFFGNRLIRRFKPYRLLMLAMVISGGRLILFFFSSTPTFVLALQLLAGFTFPLMWIAGVAYADAHAPAGLGATAQGLFGAMEYGFGAAVGGFMGGPLLERLGGRGTYLVFGSIILAIVAIVALVQWRAAAREPLAVTER